MRKDTGHSSGANAWRQKHGGQIYNTYKKRVGPLCRFTPAQIGSTSRSASSR